MGITIGLMGDVMIGRLVNQFLDKALPQAIWGDLLPLLQATDLNVANLETALTKSEKKVPKVFNFKADPEKVACLSAARIDVVNLANNHVLDFSIEGLLETLETLKRAGILYVGAGETLTQAIQPVIVERKGIKIGILGFTDNEPEWVAGPKKPGINYLSVGDLKCAQAAIYGVRNQVDVLIFSYHWGPNMRQKPTQPFIDFAHALIDHGVDIFHGHSAHIFQGFEEYKQGLILYDTGDFVDDYAIDPILRNDQSFLFLVKVGKKGYERLEMIPVLIRNFSLHRAQGHVAVEIEEKMRFLSEKFKVQLK